MNKKFFIPENVYIIGTMNDIDRSVGSFDFAMRRRFRFVELKADKQLEMLAFCVKGFLEPNRFLCTVSYWNCHIICEDDGRYPLDKEDVVSELSHTSMLQFCQYLYDDINQNLEAWVSFMGYEDMDDVKRTEALTQQLIYLKKLISERKEWFDQHHCFL